MNTDQKDRIKEMERVILKLWVQRQELVDALERASEFCTYLFNNLDRDDPARKALVSVSIAIDDALDRVEENR